MACRRLFACHLAALFLGLTGCTASQESVPVAHVAALSGGGRPQGLREKQGILLAVEEANGDEQRAVKWKVVVYHADSEGKPDLAQAQAVRLLSVRKAVALLAGTGAEEVQLLARAAQPYNVPFLASGEMPEPLLGEFLFSTTVSPTYQGQVLARFAVENLEAKRVVALADNRDATSYGLVNGFLQELRPKKDVQAEEWPYTSEEDLAGVVRRLQKARPDAVLVGGTARDLLHLRLLLDGAKLPTRLLFGAAEGSLPGEKDLRFPGSPVYFTTAFCPEGLSSLGKEFARKYRERFGQELDVHAALAYEGAKLLFDAMQKARTPAAPYPQQELARVADFESLTGPLAFAKSHYARRVVFVVHFEGGQGKLVRRFDPEPQ
jgi:branched-chain amino acid transport system substrate-binding protein